MFDACDPLCRASQNPTSLSGLPDNSGEHGTKSPMPPLFRSGFLTERRWVSSSRVRSASCSRHRLVGVATLIAKLSTAPELRLVLERARLNPGPSRAAKGGQGVSHCPRVVDTVCPHKNPSTAAAGR